MTLTDTAIDGLITYQVGVFAAVALLAYWYQQGARSVELTKGRIEPLNSPPEPGTWPIDADAACILAATIAAGQRYIGLGNAMRFAASEFAALVGLDDLTTEKRAA